MGVVATAWLLLLLCSPQSKRSYFFSIKCLFFYITDINEKIFFIVPNLLSARFIIIHQPNHIVLWMQQHTVYLGRLVYHVGWCCGGFMYNNNNNNQINASKCLLSWASLVLMTEVLKCSSVLKKGTRWFICWGNRCHSSPALSLSLVPSGPIRPASNPRYNT